MTVNGVRVTMFNVGFGDAFLVSIDQPTRTWRMLVDCGVHTGGASQHPMKEIVDAIIAASADPDGVSRIDVVVATHRHRDHVSGFALADWDRVEVLEVWLPFTENSDDVLGSKILQSQSRKATKLHKHLLGLAANLRGAAAAAASAAAQVVENSLTNQDAMDRLHGKFATDPKIRYIPDFDGKLGRVALDGSGGAHVRFFGPRRDESVIAAMDPPSDLDWEENMAIASGLAASGGSRRADDSMMFDDGYLATAKSIEASHRHLYLSEKDRKELLQDAAFDSMAAAASVSDAVNNTSIMFMLEVGDTNLWFPGDAQWGLWKAVLDDPAAVEILRGTTVYKVGHHGSHNATSTRYARDLLGNHVVSLMSTSQVGTWPIPNEALRKSLSQGGRKLLRTDVPAKTKGAKWDSTLSVEYTVA